MLLAENNIAFIGPPTRVMHLLGDKILSNIIAQSMGVPSIPWSGDGLTVPILYEDNESENLPSLKIDGLSQG